MSHEVNNNDVGIVQCTIIFHDTVLHVCRQIDSFLKQSNVAKYTELFSPYFISTNNFC